MRFAEINKTAVVGFTTVAVFVGGCVIGKGEDKPDPISIPSKESDCTQPGVSLWLAPTALVETACAAGAEIKQGIDAKEQSGFLDYVLKLPLDLDGRCVQRPLLQGEYLGFAAVGSDGTAQVDVLLIPTDARTMTAHMAVLEPAGSGYHGQVNGQSLPIGQMGKC